MLAVPDERPHLLGKPESFRRNADVLLVLDSKIEMLVHSAILSAHSEALSNMLTVLEEAQTGTAVRALSFPGCTDEEANAFLVHLYAEDRSRVLSVISVRSLSAR